MCLLPVLSLKALQRKSRKQVRHGPFDIQGGGGGLEFWSGPRYFFRIKSGQDYFFRRSFGSDYFFFHNRQLHL